MKRKRKRKSIAQVVFFKLMAENTLIRLKDSFQCWQSQQLFSFFLFCSPGPHIWGGRKVGKRVKYNFVFVTPHQHSTPSFFLAQQILRVVFFFHNEDIYFCLGVHNDISSFLPQWRYIYIYILSWTSLHVLLQWMLQLHFFFHNECYG